MKQLCETGRIFTGALLDLGSEDAEAGSTFQTETLSLAETVSLDARCKSASVIPELSRGSCSTEMVFVLISDRSEMLERAAKAPLLIASSSSCSGTGNDLRENVCKQSPMCSRKLLASTS